MSASAEDRGKALTRCCRFEFTRRRSEQDGGFAMDVETGRVIVVRPREAADLMRPFGNRRPQTAAEWDKLQDEMRRTLRILEGGPNNLGARLSGVPPTPLTSFCRRRRNVS